MTGRSTIQLLKPVAGLFFAVAIALFLGCSASPRERYRVLSVFFDGVPNPDAPRKSPAVSAIPGESRVLTAAVVSRHKPYNDGQCTVCHTNAAGDIEDFDKAYDRCVKCHKDLTAGLQHVHGPVANAACRWCHAPHESSQPALLKDVPIAVCTQCHDQQVLGNNPPQHTDGKTSCLDCHFGHGGPDPYYLKPAATNPATTNPAAPSQVQTPKPADSVGGGPAPTTIPAPLPPPPAPAAPHDAPIQGGAQ